MNVLMIVLQVGIALTILNVWFLRYSKKTPFRAGDAQNMEEEFEVYGLPKWFVKVIFVAKVSMAICLIAGIWVSVLVPIGAIGMALLMAGAVAMHFRVRDPFKKTAPALTLFVLSVLVCLMAFEVLSPAVSVGIS